MKKKPTQTDVYVCGSELPKWKEVNQYSLAIAAVMMNDYKNNQT